MTTEILRNIMYRQADTERNPEREDRLATVGLVVLDEVDPLGIAARCRSWHSWCQLPCLFIVCWTTLHLRCADAAHLSCPPCAGALSGRSWPGQRVGGDHHQLPVAHPAPGHVCHHRQCT
jgi:hypothetical protein